MPKCDLHFIFIFIFIIFFFCCLLSSFLKELKKIGGREKLVFRVLRHICGESMIKRKHVLGKIRDGFGTLKPFIYENQ